MVTSAFSEFNGGVSYGGVSIGETTARLGVKIDRGVVDLLRADDMFCNHRLTGYVVLGRKSDGDGQQTITEDIDHKVCRLRNGWHGPRWQCVPNQTH